MKFGLKSMFVTTALVAACLMVYMHTEVSFGYVPNGAIHYDGTDEGSYASRRAWLSLKWNRSVLIDLHYPRGCHPNDWGYEAPSPL